MTVLPILLIVVGVLLLLALATGLWWQRRASAVPAGPRTVADLVSKRTAEGAFVTEQPAAREPADSMRADSMPADSTPAGPEPVVDPVVAEIEADAAEQEEAGAREGEAPAADDAAGRPAPPDPLDAGADAAGADAAGAGAAGAEVGSHGSPGGVLGADAPWRRASLLSTAPAAGGVPPEAEPATDRTPGGVPALALLRRPRQSGPRDPGPAPAFATAGPGRGLDAVPDAVDDDLAVDGPDVPAEATPGVAPAAEAATAEPPAAEVVVAEPSAAEVVVAEPPVGDPVVPPAPAVDSDAADPAVPAADRAVADPAVADPAVADPAVADSPVADPAVAAAPAAGADVGESAVAAPQPVGRPVVEDRPHWSIPGYGVDRHEIEPGSPASETARSAPGSFPSADPDVMFDSPPTPEPPVPAEPPVEEPAGDGLLGAALAGVVTPDAPAITTGPRMAEPAAPTVAGPSSDGTPAAESPATEARAHPPAAGRYAADVAAGPPAAGPEATAPVTDPGRPRRDPTLLAAEQAAADLALLRTFGSADLGSRPERAPVVALESCARRGSEPLEGAAQPVRFRAVRRDGTAIPDAAVALLDDRGRESSAGRSDVAGTGELRAPHPGGYVLVATAPDHQPGAVALTVGDAPVVADVLLVRSASLVGRVTGEDGPITGARITLVQDGEVVDSTDSGEGGGYAVTDMAAGEYALSVAAAGCEPHVALVVVPDEAELVLDVELQPAGVPAG
jgi:hypothetical protein